MKHFIGIDIGASGAISELDENGKLIFTCIIPKIGNQVDVQQLNKIIFSFKERSHIVIIEDLHAIFGTSAKSNYQFGWINGIIEALLVSANLRFEKVSPKIWQNICWQGIRPIEINTGKKKKNGEIKYKIDTKSTSLLAAQRIFPGESFIKSERSRIADHNIVDSSLLSYYGYIKFK